MKGAAFGLDDDAEDEEEDEEEEQEDEEEEESLDESDSERASNPMKRRLTTGNHDVRLVQIFRDL